MRRILFLCLLFFITGCKNDDVALLFDQYIWEKRVLLIFAPEFENKLLKEQSDIINKNTAGFKERHLVTWILVDNEYVTIDQEYKPQLPVGIFYEYFNVKNDEFTVILLGKDGEEKFRQNNKLLTKQKLFNEAVAR
ncbi:MAG: DUF4174 domain-containing protein [Pseudomonadota bacterium]